MKKPAALTLLLLSMLSFGKAQDAKTFHQDILVVDGHNDVLITSILPGRDIGKHMKTGHTDIPRLQAGGVDVQVFAVWSDDKKWKTNAFKHANEQIDALEKVIQNNPTKIALAKHSTDIERIQKSGKIAALIGIEGGNMIEGSTDNLEKLYNRGARYLTLTWNYNLPWVTAAAEEVKTKGNTGKGLTKKGEEIIQKMNALGMMIDLSHAGKQTFYDVLRISTKPVLVSHSNAAALTPHYRNLDDKQLEALKKNGGVIGVNFYSEFLDSDYTKRVRKLYKQKHSIPKGEKAPSIGKMYQALTPKQRHLANAPMETVLKHIDYLVGKVGINHVAIGSDFDGIESPPQGLEDVSKFPTLTEALLERGYSKTDVAKIMGLNFLRLLQENEN
ncbi:dipeptidase [Sphingobacterium lactis]|uniref:Membrane dipeptidase n=1 Tax=Sphingobacterium lactis TaxID=797291 RepID=A0A1H5ZHX3_9SPHI|nr:dipeptidase [Sphingobacterium lactis]SEG35851.1 membrane dipeptidase [Sphingobacterium lactis]